MRVVGQENIAAVFGVAPKTIVEWQEQGFPIAVRGRPGVPSEYDSSACIAWYVDREVRKVQDEKPGDRLSRLKADEIELNLMERRGLLIPADQLEPKLRAAFVAAREAWLNEPARISRAVQGKTESDAEQLLQEAFEGFLVRLSQWRAAESLDDEGDEE